MYIMMQKNSKLSHESHLFFLIGPTFKKMYFFLVVLVSIAAFRLSLVAVSSSTLHCGSQAFHCNGFSYCGA